MKPKNEQQTVRISMRINATLYKNLLKMAKRRKEKRSAIIRKAIAFYLVQN